MDVNFNRDPFKTGTIADLYVEIIEQKYSMFFRNVEECYQYGKMLEQTRWLSTDLRKRQEDGTFWRDWDDLFNL